MHDPSLRLLLAAFDRAADGGGPAALAAAGPVAAAVAARVDRARQVTGAAVASSPYLAYLVRTGGPRSSDAPLAESA